jgi:hypothetical protein
VGVHGLFPGLNVFGKLLLLRPCFFALGREGRSANKCVSGPIFPLHKSVIVGRGDLLLNFLRIIAVLLHGR